MSDNTLLAIFLCYLIGGCTVTCSGPKIVEAWKEPDLIRAKNESVIQALKSNNYE